MALSGPPELKLNPLSLLLEDLRAERVDGALACRDRVGGVGAAAAAVGHHHEDDANRRTTQGSPPWAHREVRGPIESDQVQTFWQLVGGFPPP